ncbi:Phospholipase_D-nuclease N-terminal [Salegentibacter echinorum]|uniref:Phospholipase_D-nuclease N-terminal n=1 Tax=Salegentibacter echinorum TaxID=1073325 RepID=A0A1M5KUC7_SALEC|nr:PLD nuclease N-terminal domain-containing protein [Salegentibacter echinorum]SHG55753.1 Phospholipase_D-nuclease N-terminal [Salegentibacter echinorum]
MTALALGTPQIILIGVSIIPLIALIDILRNDFQKNDKLIWILMVIFLNIIGGILYLFMGRKQRVKKQD